MRPPLSTYRLQFNRSFTFKDAKEAVDYLSALGITDIYASPVFKARSGSIHGYDVVDPNFLNPELGDVPGFKELITAVKGRSMGWVQDVVPNHMAYDGNNLMLMDVFEKGKGSRYASFFDIEWNHPYEGIKGKVLAPFLGSFYGDALEGGEITLRYGDGGFSACYFGFTFPLKIESYSDVIGYEIRRLAGRLSKDDPDFIKFLGLLYVIKNLPAVNGHDELIDQVMFIKGILWELYSRNPEIKKFIDENLDSYNGKKGDPESFNMLDRLLSGQFFKFSFWKVAAEEINYRRFFNINELICLNAGDEDVFGQTHALLFRLIEDAGITGIRVDHIDGLYNPLDYLKKLKSKTGDVYTVVEKILGSDEELRSSWPVEGTTGYDFLNHLNGIFCESAKEARFTKAYASFSGMKTPYGDLFYAKKKLITEMDMTSDVSNLAHLLKLTLSKDRHGSDITLPGLKKAIVEVMASFPVYRCYVSPESFTEADASYIKEAADRAARKNPALLNEIRFVEKVLTLDYRGYFTEEEKNEWLHFAMRFQQFTGPLMAKGFEDTLLYVYNRLLSLNDVGGDPARFGRSRQSLHNFLKNRAEKTPCSMNATSTHDTKRGEDARARINVLSEMPDEWEERLKRWSAFNRRKKKTSNGGFVPDRNDEYFIYQTLLGAMPFGPYDHGVFIERIKKYIVKAVREAKIHTAWLKPDTEYEETYLSFVEAILKDTGENRFLKDFLEFQKKIAWYGLFNSLSQLMIKITAPGVPDFYQGTELWDFNLVDPDNRRPVDFNLRSSLLNGIKERSSYYIKDLARELLRDFRDGRVKMFLTHMALNARNGRPDLFMRGKYIPLEVRGALKAHIFSFARSDGDTASITIAPRFLSYLVKEGELPLGEDVWGDTEVVLDGGFGTETWRNMLTGERVEAKEKIKISSALDSFPAALLMSEKTA